VLEKALVQWLSQKDAGMVGSSERRLVEIKKTSSASFLDSLRGSAGAPGKQGDKGASAESQSSLAQRANVVSGLAAQLEQLSCKNWAYGRPPLSWAVNNGLVSVVRQSLNAGSDVNRCDALCRTPLHECAALISSTSLECHFEAAVEIAEVLLQAGADCNAASVSGRRPLHELFCRGQDDAVSFAKISLKSSSKKATPATAPCTKALFHVVSGASSQGVLQDYRRQLTKTLLGFGADPVLHDRQGMGAIHYCARENDAGCMLEILRRHCDVSRALTSR
jgi:ankyrin repeat protein